MAEFKTGDHVVYPGHGVGVITAIDVKDIMGCKQEFYSIEISESSQKKIMIPKDNAEANGLRHIISIDDSQKVLDILQKKDVKIDKQTWNRQHREYMDKIKTGSVYEIAEVLRDLYLLKVDKDLSFSQKNILGKARKLLLRELLLAMRKEELNQGEVGEILGFEEKEAN